MSEVFKVIGLMSGTSLDGVDAALLDTDGESAARCGSDACHAAWTRAKCEGLPLSLPSTIGMLYPMPGGRLHLPTA